MTLEVVTPTAALLDGRYLLKDRVGQGGMATVYRAEDTHLGRTVAIKMIHPGDEAASSIERAHSEKKALASLSHPSLVTLFDAQLDPGRPQYLVMEFVDGPTLAQRMATGPIPSRELAVIARDLAQGLAAAHAAGIVHRDVKPSNVLLQRRGTRSGGAWSAKLADFGIACMVDGSRMTTPGIVLGTLSYMAPEQLRDLDPGTPADIFALGLVILEALTGEPGYTPIGSGRAAAIARLAGAPSVPGNVDPAWRQLLERMTAMEPGERPTAAEVARAARGLMSGERQASAVVAHTQADEENGSGDMVIPAGRPRPIRVRKRVIAGATGLAVAGIAVAAAMVWAPGGGESARDAVSVMTRTVTSVDVAPESDVSETDGTEQETTAEPAVTPVIETGGEISEIDRSGEAGDKPENFERADKSGKPDHAGKPGRGAKD
jgi:eukaryotic-like serine/threonine-protein kinase